MKINDFSQLDSLMKTASDKHAVTEVESPRHENTKRKKKSGHRQPAKQSSDENTSHLKRGDSRSGSGMTDAFLLRRDIKIFCWNAKATISKSSKRDELMPVLLRAQENDGTYGKDIAAHLLGEEVSREVVGVRSLTICESLGLLKNQGEKKRPRYYLTEAGSEALESGNVMVPEEGTWTIWASDDPLLGYSILHIEPFSEDTAFNEVHGDKKKETKSRNDKFENIPNWFRKNRSRISLPAAIGRKLIRLDDIDQRVEPVKMNAHLTLEWKPELKSLKLKGSINGNNVNATPEAPETPFNHIWQELLENEQLWPRWEESKERLLISFDSTINTERTSMQRLLEFSKPHLSHLGTFGSTHQSVAIFPQSQEDAQLWAEWKLQNRINTYATEPEYARWCKQAIQPFEEYSDIIELPKRNELAEDIWEKRHDQQHTSAVWHLMAVEDWGI